jgi:thiosulfate/3-mercaptopyruvate sulfurtransferase
MEAIEMGTAGKLADPEVDVGYIASHPDDPSIRLVEVDVSPAAYQEGHIPGAVLWDAYTDLRHPDYARISEDELASLVRRSGIGADTTVVFYGYGAHLGYWLLRSCGHDRVRLMDGSREQWTEAGHQWSTEVPAYAETDYVLGPQDRFVASEEEVRSVMAGGQGLILDVRSEAEYEGVNFWPSGAPESVGRPGRIPGAVFAPVATIRTSDGRFTDLGNVGHELGARAPDRSTPIVTYCTVGNRAAQVWYALTVLLGYEDVRVFYGSWVEWGMRTDSPVEP